MVNRLIGLGSETELNIKEVKIYLIKSRLVTNARADVVIASGIFIAVNIFTVEIVKLQISSS